MSPGDGEDCDDSGHCKPDGGEDCDDAGDCSSDAGVGGGEGDGVEYSWIYIVDESDGIIHAGTPGTDICGHMVACGGRTVEQIGFPVFIQGAGGVCSAPGEPIAGCSTARNLPTAALDNGLSCEAASDPSDYVSVGFGGTLAIPYDSDLRGCEISVVSFRGFNDEPYSVYVSPSETGDPNILVATSRSGESTSGTVPARE